MSSGRQIAGPRHAGVQGRYCSTPNLSDLSRNDVRCETPCQLTPQHACEPKSPVGEIDDPMLRAAMSELERLVVDARRAISIGHRFQALSSLVAIQPLISHLLDSCNDKLNTAEPNPNDQDDGPAGYI